MKRLKRQLSEGPSDVDKCPKTAAEIKKEMQNYSNIMKFKAMELDIDEEDEAEVQDSVPSSTQYDLTLEDTCWSHAMSCVMLPSY